MVEESIDLGYPEDWSIESIRLLGLLRATCRRSGRTLVIVGEVGETWDMYEISGRPPGLTVKHQNVRHLSPDWVRTLERTTP